MSSADEEPDLYNLFKGHLDDYNNINSIDSSDSIKSSDSYGKSKPSNNQTIDVVANAYLEEIQKMNQTIDVVANAYLEEIHKMNQINQIVTNQMENSNNDSELIMHQKIIEENNEKIKEYTDTYNKIQKITDINKIREITDIYDEFLNDKVKIYLYFIKFIVDDYKLLTPRPRDITESKKDITRAKSHKSNVGTKYTKSHKSNVGTKNTKYTKKEKKNSGGKKSKKIMKYMKSKKSKSKKYIKSKK
jgi:hypothetical protein